MIVPGLLFLFCGLISAYVAARFIIIPTFPPRPPWYSAVCFWFFMALFSFYHSVVATIPIPWDRDLVFRLLYVGLLELLRVIPVGFLILMFCEILATQFEVRDRVIFLLRVIIIYSLLVLTSLVVILSYVDWGPDDPIGILRLWQGCADLLCGCYIGPLASKVLTAISYPINNVRTNTWIRRSKVMVWIFVFLLVVRSCYNFTAFFEANPIEDWREDGDEAGQRTFSVLWSLFTDIVPAGLSMLAAYFLNIQRSKSTDQQPFDSVM
jgi:membrane protein CcdC involved in cytochrome C biogenesis